MLDINKLYTKKEYLDLLHKENYSLGIGDCNEEGENFEFYVSSNLKKVTPKIKELYKEGKLGIFTINKDYHSMIRVALEAVERIRTQKGSSSYAKKVRKEHSIKANNNQYYKGYWSGVLACIRYISDYKFTIDDLREVKQLEWILKKGIKNN